MTSQTPTVRALTPQKQARTPRRLMTRAIVGLALAVSIGSSLQVSHAQAFTPAQSTEDGVVNLINTEIYRMWKAVFANRGSTFRAPYIKYYNTYGTRLSTQVPVNCDLDAVKDGWFTAARRYYSTSTWREGNSFYCPTNERVYLDFNWNNFFITRVGDGAGGVLFAHEYAHHIQHLLGWDTYLKGHGRFAAFELQADCYAGLAMRYLNKRGLLSAGDVMEAKILLSTLGDDNVSPYGVRPRDAHGTSAQRVWWFMNGFQTYRLSSCNM